MTAKHLAHLQTLNKPPAQFKKDLAKIVEVAFTRFGRSQAKK